MHNTPAFTFTRLLGGISCAICFRGRKSGTRERVIVLAAGLILGESLGSVVNLTLSALGQ
jgi:uncharacterized oligopeptide transporter (OPT) family protein